MTRTQRETSGQREVNLFVASSPRHVLLSAGLALERGPDAENHLFLIEHLPADSVTDYLELLRHWKESPFASVERLLGDHRKVLGESRGLSGSLKKVALKRSFRAGNAKLLRERIEASPPDRVYVGCDNYFESQYALREAKRRDPRTRGLLVEDGVAAYDHDYRNLRFRRSRDVIRKVRYGPWYRSCPIIGTSGWIDAACVAFPELVIEELEELELHALPLATFRSPGFLNLARDAVQRFGVDLERLADTSLIIAVTRSTAARQIPGYEDTILALCDALTERGATIALKYHPREVDPSFLPVADKKGIHVVPAPVMFELLVALIESPRLTVIGDASTSVIATRWLRPDARVLAVGHGTNARGGRFLHRAFGELGIPIESDLGKIRDACLGG